MNIAARLQTVAAPGSICGSEAVYQQVYTKLDLAFEDLGVRELKNIDRRESALILLVRRPIDGASVSRIASKNLIPHNNIWIDKESAMIGKEVLEADDRRFDAMRRQDWPALEARLAEDLVYVHSTARRETKAEHVGNLRAGKPYYRGIAPRERSARVFGDVGVVNGTSDMHVENAGKENRFTVRYLAVYAKSGGAWRMVAWQSTKVPDA